MEESDDFDSIFGTKLDLAYNHQVIEQIHHHRRALENELFFDRLLKAVGVDQASKLYPPRSNQDLRNLYQRIVTSTSPDHHKQSLVYYILKDLPSQTQSSVDYAKNCYIPNKYQVFIDGIWYLDRLVLERALDYLTDPCLVPTFPEDILYTLCRHAPKDDPSLPLSYYHTVSPIISSTRVLDTLFNTMCSASITEAFFFSRSHGELIHQHLFELLVCFVHANSEGDIRASRAVELLGLPLDEKEEAWLEEYLVKREGNKLAGAKDTIMMRRIAMGRLLEAIEFSENLSGRTVDGVSWTTLRGGLQQGSKPQAVIKSAIPG
ncbi:MAG: hypothetical protein Q9187_000992 [Circinaria calcarea]